MPLRLGRRTFADDDLLVMAIVNRTPDSFYDQGATFDDAPALEAVDRAVAEGADIVDIGGVKAGPGAEVDAAEEIRRTAAFVGRGPRAPPRPRHQRRHLAARGGPRSAARPGADVLNDAWGGTTRGSPRSPPSSTSASSARTPAASRRGPGRTASATTTSIADILRRTVVRAERAVALGVDRDAVLIDPGHDFGKNTWHSLEATRRIAELVATGWPVLVSLSNKDFVGETLDRPVGERLTGTLATTAVSAWLGARVFRAHNVRETRETLDMVATIRGTRPPSRDAARPRLNPSVASRRSRAVGTA